MAKEAHKTKQRLVVFTPSGLRGQVAVGTTVLEAARKLGVDLDSVCGGRGICSRCKVKPAKGTFPKFGITTNEKSLSPWNAIEEKIKNKRAFKEGERLGCQAKIYGDVIIDIPKESQVHKQVVRKRAEVRDVTVNPATKLYYVEVTPPDIHNPTGDLQRLKIALKNQWGIKNCQIGLKKIQELQNLLRKGDWKITCAVFNQRGELPEIIAIWPGFFELAIYGLAVDLGSTTIAAHLCNLRTGEVIHSTGVMNPQIRFGEDLMSRVSFSMMNKDGTDKLKTVVRESLNELCIQIVNDCKIDKKQLVEITLVCNPVMHHLLLGINPTELGQAPFALATSDSLYVNSLELDLTFLGNTKVYILPCIAGHVGADAAAVILSEEPNESKENVLIIDVGTNAELILGNKKKVLTCSSPTGPAFEGAQISSGQRAAPGAIENVRINPKTKEPVFKVIGCEGWSNEPEFSEYTKGQGISGICGSGIIEAVAEMRIAGILDPSGLIGSHSETGSERCILEDRTNSYVLHDGRKNGGSLIKVTNADVRAIQLAKAALFAGSRLLMDEMGIDQVDRIVLAGAFGSHISSKHAMILGMIPDCQLDKVTSAGNAAGTGARIALLNIEARERISKTVKNILKIETAMEPRFQDYFVSASAIPNSVYDFFELKKVVSLPDINFNQKRRPNRRRAGQS